MRVADPIFDFVADTTPDFSDNNPSGILTLRLAPDANTLSILGKPPHIDSDGLPSLPSELPWHTKSQLSSDSHVRISSGSHSAAAAAGELKSLTTTSTSSSHSTESDGEYSVLWPPSASAVASAVVDTKLSDSMKLDGTCPCLPAPAYNYAFL